MKLLPEVYRQRLHAEFLTHCGIISSASYLSTFLVKLAEQLKMEMIGVPMAWGIPLPDGQMGWHCAAIWIASGAQVYTWPEHNFCTIEIYTCKEFDVETAINCIVKWFQPDELWVSKPEEWMEWK